MKITLGFSPCPNDTFIFDALVNGDIDTGDVQIEPVLEDVETLNQWALQGKIDVTKLSFPAYFQTKDTYQLLDAGAAMGQGVGPLLITHKQGTVTEEDINEANIVLPGANTTAHLLFSYAYPHARKKTFAVFHEIEDKLINREADFGVIIHENRFTYQDKGLHKVKDLGEYWVEKMQVPIPLGAIAIKKSLGQEIYARMNEWIHHSLSMAFVKFPDISDYIKQHAQTMSEDVMHEHIKLYVNQYTLSLGMDGRKAVDVLEGVYKEVSS
ncbi:MAG: 1,4-dihydroxy-6-naphthoate synthase [Niabella sp.]